MAKSTRKTPRPAKRFEVFKNDSDVITDINAWNFRRMYNSEILYTGRGYDKKHTALLMARKRTAELKVPLPILVLD